MIIPPIYDDLGNYAEGKMSFLINGKIGMFDCEGSMIIKPFLDLSEGLMPMFSEGLACAHIGALAGYIDSYGQWVLKPQWYYGGNFLKDYALVEGNKYQIIDKKGSCVKDVSALDISRSPTWVNSWDFIRFLTWVGSGVYMGSMNFKGDIVVQPEYYFLGETSSDILAYYPDEDNENFGLMNNRGNIITDVLFNKSQSYFSDGFAAAGIAVDDGNNFSVSRRLEGYINNRGEWLIEPFCETAGPFANGRACFGNAVQSSTEDENGHTSKRHGFINRKGEIIIEDKYSRVKPFSGGFAIAYEDEQCTVIDTRGQTVWKEED